MTSVPRLSHSQSSVLLSIGGRRALGNYQARSLAFRDHCYNHSPKDHCRCARTAGRRQVFSVAEERQRGAAWSPSGVHVKERLWREVPPAAARIPWQRWVEPEAACLRGRGPSQTAGYAL